jgi:hypothetical protein
MASRLVDSSINPFLGRRLMPKPKRTIAWACSHINGSSPDERIEAFNFLAKQISFGTVSLNVTIIDTIDDILFTHLPNDPFFASDSYRAQLLRSQALYTLFLYPQHNPTFFSLESDGVLHSGFSNFVGFLDNLSSVLTTSFPIVMFYDPVAVKKQMLDDGSQSNILQRIRELWSQRCPPFYDMLAKLIHWIDPTLFINFGLADSLHTLLAENQSDQSAQNLLFSFCDTFGWTIPHSEALLRSLTNPFWIMEFISRGIPKDAVVFLRTILLQFPISPFVQAMEYFLADPRTITCAQVSLLTNALQFMSELEQTYRKPYVRAKTEHDQALEPYRDRVISFLASILDNPPDDGLDVCDRLLYLLLRVYENTMEEKEDDRYAIFWEAVRPTETEVRFYNTITFFTYMARPTSFQSASSFELCLLGLLRTIAGYQPESEKGAEAFVALASFMIPTMEQNRTWMDKAAYRPGATSLFVGLISTANSGLDWPILPIVEQFAKRGGCILEGCDSVILELVTSEIHAKALVGVDVLNSGYTISDQLKQSIITFALAVNIDDDFTVRLALRLIDCAFGGAKRVNAEPNDRPLETTEHRLETTGVIQNVRHERGEALQIDARVRDFLYKLVDQQKVTEKTIDPFVLAATSALGAAGVRLWIERTVKKVTTLERIFGIMPECDMASPFFGFVYGVFHEQPFGMKQERSFEVLMKIACAWWPVLDPELQASFFTDLQVFFRSKMNQFDTYFDFANMFLLFETVQKVGESDPDSLRPFIEWLNDGRRVLFRRYLPKGDQGCTVQWFRLIEFHRWALMMLNESCGICDQFSDPQIAELYAKAVNAQDAFQEELDNFKTAIGCLSRRTI